MQSFATTTAGRTPALPTRRASADFPTKLSPGVSLRTVLACLAAWTERSAERKALAQLLGAGDHVLNDIGLCRDDLIQVMRKP